MIKSILAAGGIAVLLAGQALAYDVPTDTESCFAIVDDLAQKAEEKNVADDQIEKVLEQLSAIEGRCDASEFAEAKTAADALGADLDK